MFIPADIKRFASTHETSDEIAAAIFEIAEEDTEERVWLDPTGPEMEMILARAWDMAEAETKTLHWGQQAIDRPDADGFNT